MDQIYTSTHLPAELSISHTKTGFLADAVELASVPNKDKTTLANTHFYQCSQLV